MAPLSPRLFILLPFIALHGLTTAANQHQTISALPAFTSQRPCATSCFFDEVGRDLIGVAQKCCAMYTDNNCDAPVADACFCRADLRPAAVSWLSLCVDTRCSTNAVDRSSAVAVFDGYCGAAATPTQPGAGATDGGPPPPTRPAGTATGVAATQGARNAAGERLGGVRLGMVAAVVLTVALQAVGSG